MTGGLLAGLAGRAEQHKSAQVGGRPKSMTSQTISEKTAAISTTTGGRRCSG